MAKGPVRGALNLLITIAVAVGLAFLIQAFFVKPFKVPTGSMLPTLALGQRVIVDRIGMEFGNPSVGSIVVFRPPLGAETSTCGGPQAKDAACDTPTPTQTQNSEFKYFIKRIVAGPGDRIKIVGGHVIRNGVAVKDPYVKHACPQGAPAKCDFPAEITIPRDHYYMMGDNRGYSGDSRFWGPIPKSWIIGEAFFTYWPLDRIGFL